MCLSCGCGEPMESHGDARNITLARLEEAAQAANISPQDAARNIIEATESTGVSERSQERAQ